MRRRLLIVVVFLLAGAVVNVAVAWGCWLGCDFPPGQGTPLPDKEVQAIAAAVDVAPEIHQFGEGTTDSYGFGVTADMAIFRDPVTWKFRATALRFQAGLPVHAMRGYMFKTSANPSPPPQTIMRSPVQTAVCEWRCDGAPTADVGVQESRAGS